MRVLFVEDDAINRLVVRDMLSLAGAELAEAESAEAGLQLMGAQDYDLVLMDLRMPGMDGMAAIRRIREIEAGARRTPIVVVTADTAVNLRSECVDAGADDFLNKPVAMNDLFGAIARLVARDPALALC